MSAAKRRRCAGDGVQGGSWKSSGVKSVNEVCRETVRSEIRVCKLERCATVKERERRGKKEKRRMDGSVRKKRDRTRKSRVNILFLYSRREAGYVCWHVRLTCACERERSLFFFYLSREKQVDEGRPKAISQFIIEARTLSSPGTLYYHVTRAFSNKSIRNVTINLSQFIIPILFSLFV